jgi:tetratricopeptide (TPR) repeat protein
VPPPCCWSRSLFNRQRPTTPACIHTNQLTKRSPACSRLLTLYPKFAGAYYKRGTEYMGKGDYDRAIADFDQKIRLDPKYAAAYSNRGGAYNGKGDYDRAIFDYDQAIWLDLKYAVADSNRGGAYEAKNDLDHAIVDFDQALKLDPSLIAAQRARARAGAARKAVQSRRANQHAGQMSAYANVAALAVDYRPDPRPKWVNNGRAGRSPHTSAVPRIAWRRWCPAQVGRGGPKPDHAPHSKQIESV